jgi:hypothetical protein
MHGPGASETPGTCSPTWRGVIPVVDKMVFTLRQDHRIFWRQGRDRAFQLWEASGVLDFAIIEFRKPDQFTGENLLALMVPDTITIVRNAAGGGDSGGWFDGAEPNPVRGGVLVLSPWRPWFKEYWMKSLGAMIAHEVGHCLGFGHTTQGGLMGGANKPSEHELDSTRSYYGA